MQLEVLHLLAGMGWTLTDGGALAHVHLGHRTTRDLDLFWHGLHELGHLPAEVTARLVAGDLRVERLQSGVTFCRLQVSDSHEVLPIDLVADPVPTVVEPIEVAPGFLVDAPHEFHRAVSLAGARPSGDTFASSQAPRCGSSCVAGRAPTRCTSRA